MFERFWQIYPRKVSKGAALKKWETVVTSDALAEQIIKAVEAQKAYRARTQKANELLPKYKRIFIPEWKHPATWLNQQCWLDEIPSVESDQEKVKRKMYCYSCQKAEGKYPIGGRFACGECYNRKLHPELFLRNET